MKLAAPKLTAVSSFWHLSHKLDIQSGPVNGRTTAGISFPVSYKNSAHLSYMTELATKRLAVDCQLILGIPYSTLRPSIAQLLSLPAALGPPKGRRTS